MSDSSAVVATVSSFDTVSQSRSKFFHMIGIEAAPPQQQQTTAETAYPAKAATAALVSPDTLPASWLQSTGSSREGLATPTSNNPSSSLMSAPVLLEEALKYDKRADAAAVQSTQTKRKRSRKRLIDFNETVKVIPIPMRNEYSNRVRSRLWSGAYEIHQNAARNTFEFASEGWDWRSVAEDERMYVCVATGELIHPCHYEADYQATRNGAPLDSHPSGTPSN